ncbi:MAG: phage portal protein [Clostridia bacterium]|nr:phage portal protein [Clostridia bacterium]
MTQAEIIKSSLPNIDSEIIKSFIKDDMASPLKKQMRIGQNYFEGKHDICFKKLNEYTIKGTIKNDDGTEREVEKIIEIPNKSLVKVAHRYHWKLVKQKQNYVAGKPITITYEPIIDEDLEEEQVKKIKKDNKKVVGKFWDILGPGFDNFIKESIVNMSNKALAVWHPYYNEQGKLIYCNVDPLEVIDIYDTKTQKILTDVLHNYQIIENEKKKRYVEWETSQETKYYIEDTNEIAGTEEYLPDVSRINPEPHWITQHLFNGQLSKVEPHGWGKVPYIIIKNNEEKQTDLEPIKDLIDAYDLINSNFINTIEDLKEFIYKINGYGAENLVELVERIKIMGIVRNNDATGKIETETIPFPYEARQIILKLLEEKIYEFGRGVNTNRSELIGQAPSGISLEFLYTDLDLKADECIANLTEGLYQLFWFIAEHLKRIGEIPQDLDVFDFKFTFNKSRIFNTTEQINTINSDNTISTRTKLENHPLVDDVDQELQRLKEEKEENMKMQSQIFNNSGGFDDEHNHDEE